MEFNKKEWTGNWVNFEKYIYSTEAAMQHVLGRGRRGCEGNADV